MNTSKLVNAMSLAANGDDTKTLELLKKTLTDNGFKHTSTAANIMLNEMADRGLDEEAVAYYKTVAHLRLPVTEAPKKPQKEPSTGGLEELLRF